MTLGLIPALKKAAEISGRKSRVISLSSLAHVISDVDLNDPNFKNRSYDPWMSYGQSKTANILFSIALTKLYFDQGIVSYSVMPGGISTPLQRHMTHEDKLRLGVVDAEGKVSSHFKSVEQGASTTVWAAVASELEDKGGYYLENCQLAELRKSREEVMINRTGLLKYAIDEDKALKLWNLSLEWIKNPPK